MDESDDEFTELCAKLLRRVKRNAAEDNVKASRSGPRNGAKSTAAQTTSKKPKPAAKSKNQDGTCRRKKAGLCPESGGDSEGARTEPEKADSNEKVAVQNVTLPCKELQAGVPPLALQEGSAQQRPHSDGGNDLFQTGPIHSDEWKPDARCAGTIHVPDVQSHAVTQTGSGMGLQHLDLKAVSVFSVQSQQGTEMAQAEGAKSKLGMETNKADNVPPQMGIGAAPVETVSVHGLEEMAPTERIHRQAALKTASAAVVCPRAVDRALERMQKFKRADPRRIKHSVEESSATATNELMLEQELSDNVNNPTLSEVENDRALALALQRDTSSQEKTKSLEEEGFYFCQICQKDLSAMNSALRQEHMNRCLDEVETAEVPLAAPAAPRVPECPICGKQFSTVKSRAAHLKRCAVTMQVPPQVLLQAVQMQTMDSEISVPPLPSSTAGRTKRKGSAKESAPTKKYKPSIEVSKAEDMLVALVMSRSLLEQECQDGTLAVASVKPEVALPIKMKPGAEKKSRKKKKEALPPPLLIQDPETAIKQIQNRVSALLTEEIEFHCTPTLPASRFLVREDLDYEWRYLSSVRGAVLWQCSKMTDTPPLDFFYTKELAPPISPWIAPQNQKKQAVKPLIACDNQRLFQAQPTNDSTDLAAQVVVKDTTDEKELQVNPVAKLNQHYGVSACSQRDQEALQDLMELAGEGITLTQWKLAAEQSPSIEVSGKESVVSDITPSGFVPSPKESKKMRRSSCRRVPLPLGTLAADFGGMVNNPHLSDVQFQMDCGSVLYAHLFVLYARCPLLVELVHDEGFLVEEDGDMRCRRVLLNDVTADAACSFLRYLYCASTEISPCSLADVAALSVRFGVSELFTICENNHLGSPETDGMDTDDDVFSDTKEENEGYNQADNFQELLKSMWVDEDEEVLAEVEGGHLEEDRSLQENEVDEEELEEIYEFAATQRKADLDHSEEDTEGGLDSETENSENFHSELGYAVKRIDASTGMESEEPRVTMGMEHFPCAQLPSFGKEVRTQSETMHKGISVEGLQPTPCNPLECSEIAECHIAKSEKCSTPEKNVQHAGDVHNSPVPSQGILEESCKAPLKDSSLSQHSCGGLDDSYERMFSDAWGVYLEPSQVDHSKSAMGLEVAKKCGSSCSSSLLRDQFQESLPSEGSHCQSPLGGRSNSVLPALGLSPESLHPKTLTPLRAMPQTQSSPFKSVELGGIIIPPHCKVSPQSQSSLVLETELGSPKTPSKGSPQQPSPFHSPEICNGKTEMFQSSPYSPCLLSPSPESVRSKTPELGVSLQNRRSLFSSLESIKNKRNGSLFSAEAVSQLKTVVQGITRNYTNRMKQEKATPKKSPTSGLHKQSPSSLDSPSSVELQKPSLWVKKEAIIILLDSDEETELELPMTKSSINSCNNVKEELSQSVSTIGKVKKNFQSMKPNNTSMFDFEPNEDLPGPGREAHSVEDISLDGSSSSKLKLHLSCEDDQSHEEASSSMETSWLIPDTPLFNRSRNCSSQTHTKSLQNISQLSQGYRSRFEATTLDEDSNTLADKLSTSIPKGTPIQTFRTSPSTETFEKNSSHSSFKGAVTPNMSVEELNKETLLDNTIKGSPTKSLTISPVSLAPHCYDSSSTDHIQSGSPFSPTQIISAEQSLQKQPLESSISEVELGQESHVAVHLSSSGSVQTDFDLPIPVDECWNVEYLTPPEKDKPDELDFANIVNNMGKVSDTKSSDSKIPTKPIDLTGIRDVGRSIYQSNPSLRDNEISPQMAGASQNRRLSFLNSNVWEDWDEDDHLPVFSPLSQKLSNMTPPESISKQQTPVSAIPKRLLVPEVPITPLPSYSDMDTPKLKKELDRFGVRPLPKRQMVLKLKEIFQYTHQTMSSDSEEEIPTSQLQARAKSVCLPQPTPDVSAPQQGCSSTATSKKRKPGVSKKHTSDSSSEGAARTSKQRFKKPSERKKTTSTTARKKQTASLSPSKSPIKDSLPCITASQESTASSAAGSDISFESQSSTTNEFETAFASGDEEEEESISSSQAAVKEKDQAEAVRRYLHLNPDLHRKILLYEPFELAGLQAELKQNGIKISMGKLLDFLDTHCITFTTAAARKEKLGRKQQRQGKKKATAKRF